MTVAPPSGCTTCAAEDTDTFDLVHGRRCAAHPPVFAPGHAVRLASAGEVAQALTYCRTDARPTDPLQLESVALDDAA